MNVLEARVVLRDRTLLDVMDLALRFVVRHWTSYLLASAFVLAPALLVTWGIAAEAGWVWGWVFAVALSTFVAAPFTALASRLLFEEAAPLRQTLRAAASALVPLGVVRLLQGMALVAGLGCLGVPSFVGWVFFFYANEVMVLERAGVGAGLTRMQRLLAGQSGDAVMALLFLAVLHVGVVLLGDVIGRSLIEDLFEIEPPASIFAAKGSLLGLFSFWAFVPFSATCRFLVYINVRTRTEGWDVQTRFAAIAARAAGDAERESMRPERAA